MRTRKRSRALRWAVRLAMPLILAVAGCPAPEHPDENDDDATTGDDDTTAGDDDDSAGDDDTSGDDDVQEDYGPRSDDGSAPYHPDLVD